MSYFQVVFYPAKALVVAIMLIEFFRQFVKRIFAVWRNKLFGVLGSKFIIINFTSFLCVVYIYWRIIYCFPLVIRYDDWLVLIFINV